MKRVFVATLVLCIAAAAANATVTWTATYNGEYAVLGGSVDSWNLSFTSDGALITAAEFDLLLDGYQFGWPDAPTPPVLPDTLTPTWDLAQWVMTPQADCHFNGLTADFTPTIVAPAETNDFSFGANTAGDSEGLGGLSVESGISTETAALTLDLATLAWLTSEGVVGITDVPTGDPIAYANIGAGGVETELYFYAIPEPATLSLLAIGGLALIRRRRS